MTSCRIIISFLFVVSTSMSVHSQDCGDIGKFKIEYHLMQSGNDQMLDDFHIRICDDSIKALIKSADLSFHDPDQTTPPGIQLFALKDLPKTDVISIVEFRELIYFDDDDMPVTFPFEKYFSPSVVVEEDLNKLFTFYLVPVVVDNSFGTDIESIFEKNCIDVYADESLKIYMPSFQVDFSVIPNRIEQEFGMFRFPNWSEEFKITDYVDIHIQDVLGQDIDFNLHNNYTIWLNMQRSLATYNVNVYKQGDRKCAPSHARILYPFPVFQFVIDSAYGQKGEEVCMSVTSKAFRSVTDFNFRLYWPGDSLRFDRITNVHPTLRSIIQTGLFEEEEGYQDLRIRPKFDWKDTISILEGEVLFELCFTPLVNGPGEIPVKAREEPFGDGDSLYVEIIDVLVNSRVKTGIITLSDEKTFNYEITPLCSAGNPDLYDFKLNLNGTKSTYTYSFNDSAIPDSVFSDSVIIIRNIPEGDYYFTVMNQDGETVGINLQVHSEINKAGFEISVDSTLTIHPNCVDPQGGQIVLMVDPPADTYSYKWKEGNQEFTDGLITGLPAGLHTFLVTDGNQCTNSITYLLDQINTLNTTWDKNQLTICPDQDSTMIDIQVAADNYRVQIDHGDTLFNPDFLYMDVGDHAFSIWTDACRLDTSISLDHVPSLIIAPVLPNELTIKNGESVHLEIEPSIPVTSIEWEFDHQIAGNDNVLSLYPDRSGYLHMRIVYPPSCHYRDSVFIDWISPQDSVFELSLPNAFSPDGDGVNDVFTVPPITYIGRINQLEIFDKYGALIYDSNLVENGTVDSPGWDGSIQGQPAPPGLYVAKGILVLHDGTQKEFIWSITLLR